MHLIVNMLRISRQMSTAPDNVLVVPIILISVSGHQQLQDCGQRVACHGSGHNTYLRVGGRWL